MSFDLCAYDYYQDIYWFTCLVSIRARYIVIAYMSPDLSMYILSLWLLATCLMTCLYLFLIYIVINYMSPDLSMSILSLWFTWLSSLICKHGLGSRTVWIRQLRVRRDGEGREREGRREEKEGRGEGRERERREKGEGRDKERGKGRERIYDYIHTININNFFIPRPAFVKLQVCK